MTVAVWLEDEADNGQAPTTMADASASPLDLAITYGATSAWSSIAAGRGLTGNNTGQRLRAVSANLVGTKIETAFSGQKKLTVEFVWSQTMVGTEVFLPVGIINDAGSHYPFVVDWTRSGGGTVTLEVWSNDIGTGDVVCTVTGALPASPTVVRIDIDTSQALAANRVAVWYNGVAQTLASNGVVQDATFSISGTDKLFLLGMNGAWGEDGVVGSSYYCSLDNVVPSTDNSTALLANNDAIPGGGGGGGGGANTSTRLAVGNIMGAGSRLCG